jgi:hypothetical protein
MDLVKLDLLKVTCPACGQQVEAVVRDDRVEGYCAVAKKRVDFLVKTKLERKDYRQDPEYRAKLRAATKKMWKNPDYRAKQKAALKKKGVGTSSS